MLAIEMPGLRNAWLVAPKLIRSAQPDPDTFQRLASARVNNVIDLREPGEHDTVLEKSQCEAAGMSYINHPLSEWEVPGQDQIVAILTDISKAIALGQTSVVHCKRGADRTGVVCACFQSSSGLAKSQIFSDLHQGGLLEVWLLVAVVEYMEDHK